MQTKPVTLENRPTRYPSNQVGGAPLKHLTRVLLDRRATAHFRADPVPEEYLDAILRFGVQAPSGYNLQPWRFVVVRDRENREKLRKAAMDQEKITEAPVVVIAFGIRSEWKGYIDLIFHEGARRGVGRPEKVDSMAEMAEDFLETMPAGLWLNRHIMIALTTMMYVAESYGLDTAPMEGFDPDAVKEAFALPDDSEVVALLAIGFAQPPDKPYPGRFAVEDIVFEESYGQSWKSSTLGDTEIPKT